MTDRPGTFPAIHPVPIPHNLFFATLPPPAVAAEMAEVWRRHGTIDPLRDATLHMTVLGLGRVVSATPPDPAHLCRRLTEFRFPAFELRFDRLRSVDLGPGRKRAIVLATGARSPLVTALARRLAAAVMPGRAGPRRLVPPHVTLAYGNGFAEDRLLERPVVWRMGEVVLVDSLVGLALHVPLARWPLGQG